MSHFDLKADALALEPFEVDDYVTDVGRLRDDRSWRNRLTWP